jgi:SAM-dependent methyltransferase
MSISPRPGERSIERLRAHYVVERSLADRLRAAGKSERRQLYGQVYDELFRQVPDHPQLTRKADPDAQAEKIQEHLRLLDPLLQPSTTFIEIGPGDCSLSVHVARRVRKVYAIDVSAEITGRVPFPPNFELIISDGSSVPVDPGTVDVAFSHQLIEHMHVEDAAEHVGNVARALKPGGVYICMTPNALGGPHDISKYFDTVASGFHMKEYTNGELADLFLRQGFRQVKHAIGVNGRFVQAPRALVRPFERVLESMSHEQRVRAAATAPFRNVIGVCLFAYR